MPHDPLRPHVHDPNLEVPPGDGAFTFALPGGAERQITVEGLRDLPRTAVPDCLIVSIGHGTTGPFTFSGVQLLHLVQDEMPAGEEWSEVEVISADGFGNRVTAEELFHPDPAGPVLLAYEIDGQPMSRDDGLVRLIVPSEKEDALRQVKWVGQIRVKQCQTVERW